MNTRNAGNIPQAAVTFFDGDKKPEVSILPEQVALTLRYNQPKKEGETKRENMVVLAKKLEFEDFNTVSGAKFLNGMIQEWRTKVAKLAADSEIPFSSVDSVEEIAKLYNESARGERISKEQVAEFFDASMAEVVIAAAMVKNPDASEEILNRIANGYKEMFQKLAGNNLGSALTEKQVILAERILAETPDHEMKTWLNGQVNKVKVAHDAARLLEDMI